MFTRDHAGEMSEIVMSENRDHAAKTSENCDQWKS